MYRYKTTEVININCGLIGLEKDQAADRILNLKSVGRGLYEVKGPIQFKAGEIIRLKSIDKYQADRVEFLDSAKKAADDKAAKKKAAAEKAAAEKAKKAAAK